MCEVLETWMDTHPAVAPRPRNERVAQTVYLSLNEAENLSRVLTDHRLFSIHGGKATELFRHALAYYLPQVLDLMDEGFRPFAELMRADIERTGIGQTIEQINDYYDTRGRELRMLLDIGETERAFTHYEKVLEFVKGRREGVWAGLLMRLLREHPEMAAFRDAVRRMSPVEENRLRVMEEDL